MLPYFYKLREYNDFESRDLWSYELNLTQKQISFLIDHLWEMKQTLIPYYYLDENSSCFVLEESPVGSLEKCKVGNSFCMIKEGPVGTNVGCQSETGIVCGIEEGPVTTEKRCIRGDSTGWERDFSDDRRNDLNKEQFKVDYVRDWRSRRLAAVRIPPVRLIDNVQI